jgi:hypothetical protein
MPTIATELAEKERRAASRLPRTTNRPLRADNRLPPSRGPPDDEAIDRLPKNHGDHEPLTITVNVACFLSGLGPTVIWGLIKQGKLPVSRFNRRTLVHYRPFRELLLDGSHPPRKTPSNKRKAAAAGNRASQSDH